jgi:hypothetical protein
MASKSSVFAVEIKWPLKLKGNLLSVENIYCAIRMLRIRDVPS